MKLKAIIVEDEANTRELLKQRISQWEPNIEIVAACSDAKEGILSIAKYRPQLIFLDIYLPDMSGFEFFNTIQSLEIETQCVIITGFAEVEYFQEAIRLGLTDYLLKPIKKDELKKAIENVIDRIASGRHRMYLSDVLQTFPKKISLPIFNGKIAIAPDNLLYAVSNGRYAELYLTNRQKELVNKSISEVEATFDAYGMVRIDRFTIINPKYLHKVGVKNQKIYFLLNGNTVELKVTKVAIERAFDML